MPKVLPKRYLGRQDPKILEHRGPVLSVEITLPQQVAAIRGDSKTYPTNALIDTGAQGTCISTAAASDLGLLPVNQMQMIGVNGPELCNVYVVDFTFPGSGINLRNWNVTEAQGLPSQEFEMLLGRDVLRHFLLVYDGERGEVGLEYPSVTSPLNGSKWNLPAATQLSGDQQSVKKSQAKKKKKRKMASKSRRKNR